MIFLSNFVKKKINFKLIKQSDNMKLEDIRCYAYIFLYFLYFSYTYMYIIYILFSLYYLYFSYIY